MALRPTLLYILAPSFSGSTLLTYLLAQHADVSTVGELKATQMGPPEDYHCSCGDLILECTFWQAMLREAEARGVPFAIDDFGTVFGGQGSLADKVTQATVRGGFFEAVRSLALHLLPGASRHLDATARHNKALTDIVCELQGGPIFLDGSKDAARLLHLINSGCWDVKVIYLQRDGRGVSASIRSHGVERYEDAVAEWRHSVTELENMRGRLDDDAVFDLHYEDLCTNAADWMQKLWSWLGVEPLEIQQQQFKSGEYHILGNAMRLSTLSEIRLDEKWKRTLSEAEQQYFDSEVGVLNKKLGYP